MRRTDADTARQRARDDLAASVDDVEGLLPDDRRAHAAPGLPELPARQVALLDRRTAASAARGSARARSRRPTGTPLIPYVNERLHLLGARAGARPDRRSRAAARLHAVRRARDEDRTAGATTASRSCSPPGSPSASPCRRSSSSAAYCASSRSPGSRCPSSRTAARRWSRTSSCSRGCSSSRIGRIRMNKQISRVAIVSLLLLASPDRGDDVLAGVGRTRPRRTAGQRDRARRSVPIKRGLIIRPARRCSRGTSPRSPARSTLYFRYYPTNGFASQTVGYSTQGRARAGLERSQNAYLTAANANLGTIWNKLNDELKGTTVRGNNLVLQPPGRRAEARRDASRGNCGAAVVLNPKTGAVYVMASSPTYNPNHIESPSGLRPHHPRTGCLSRLVGAPCSTARRRAVLAGLDVQDRHGGCGPRLRQVLQPRLAIRRPGILRSNTVRRSQRRQPGPERRRELRQRRLPAGVRALDQRRLLQHRQDARREAGARPGEEVRLLLETADRAACERGGGERALQPEDAFAVRQRGHRRPGPARVRPGASARDASADGARRRAPSRTAAR